MNKAIFKLLGFLVVLIVLGKGLQAQGISPALVSQDDEKTRSMLLSRLEVNVKIYGTVAETRMTMTFYNPHNRQLAGDLYFPLPEGSFVSGYALDINGKMVDGVVVEKEKGRLVFEQLTRRRIDPGIVEWTKGNNFKTRVFPLPPNGSRTIMVRYVSELTYNNEGTFYLLPMKYNNRVKELILHIEVSQDLIEPKIKKSSFTNFNFKKWQNGYIADISQKDIQLNEDLAVELPELETQNVSVEKNSEGDYYFLISDYPKRPINAAAMQKLIPQKLVIYWDASGSRQKADHQHEFQILKNYFAGLKDAIVNVNVIAFRNEAERAKSFVISNRNCEELLTVLHEISYDGGTQMGSLKSYNPKPDMYFLFSDGLSNFGKEAIEDLNAPLYVFSNDASANHSFLHYLASRNSGIYFNLARMTNEMVLEQIGRPLFNFISVTTDQGQIEETYPEHSQPAENRILVAGKLISADAKITVNYGVAENIMLRHEFRIKKNDAMEGEVLQTFWAQKKINDLMIFSQQNEKELAEVGQKYGLVTPGTSLIVLDNLNQYLEYKIMPPKTLPDMREQYIRTMEWRRADQKRYEEDKINRIMNLWQQRIDWWNSDLPKEITAKPQAQAVTPPPQTHTTPPPPPSPPPAAKVTPPSQPEAKPNPGSSVVQGTIVDEKGDPLPGVTITATSEKGASKVAITSAQGEFRLPFLMPGTYKIKAEMQNFKTVEKSRIILLPETRIDMGRMTMELGGKNEVITVTGHPVVDLSSQSAAGGTITPEMIDPSRARRSYDTGGRKDAKLKSVKQLDSGETSPVAAIEIEPWNPNTPYLNEIKNSYAEKAYKAYLSQREKYGNSPAFYLDCADYFFNNNQKELGLRILSNIAEMELENGQLLRILGHRLEQLGMHNLSASVFEEVLKLRPEEPQSWRDLALVLASQNKYEKAIELLNHVVMGKWDRFDEIEIVALMEMNAIIAKAKSAGITNFKVAPRLIKLLDLDVRIVLTWDADMTDIDLWVIEPTEEKAYYGHNHTSIDGLVSKDFTQGYGPEEYLIKKAMHGKYKIQVNYFGSNSQTLLGPVTVHADIFTNFGRPNEQKKSITMRLNERQDTLTVSDIDF